MPFNMVVEHLVEGIWTLVATQISIILYSIQIYKETSGPIENNGELEFGLEKRVYEKDRNWPWVKTISYEGFCRAVFAPLNELCFEKNTEPVFDAENACLSTRASFQCSLYNRWNINQHRGIKCWEYDYVRWDHELSL